MYQQRLGGTTGSDGQFRICDLTPGQYQMTAIPRSASSGTLFGAIPVTVAGEDLRGLKLVVQTGLSLSGLVVWDGARLTRRWNQRSSVSLNPTNRPRFPGERLGVQSSIPGEFAFSDLPIAEYSVQARAFPVICMSRTSPMPAGVFYSHHYAWEAPSAMLSSGLFWRATEGLSRSM